MTIPFHSLPPKKRNLKKDNNSEKLIEFYRLKIYKKLYNLYDIDTAERYSELLCRMVKFRVNKYFQERQNDDRIDYIVLDNIVDDEIRYFLNDD